MFADSADDVCPATADPCVIAEPVQIVAGSELDFRARNVEVSGNGRIDFGAGDGALRCGQFTASVAGDAIVARGPDGNGRSSGGAVKIVARQACGAGSDFPCFEDDDCQLGVCDTHRCAKDDQARCNSDTDCVLGDCLEGGVCRWNYSRTCQANADCNLGPCGPTTCRDATFGAVICASNADCALGACTGGTGDLAIDGKISAASALPGSVSLVAAGTVSVRGRVNLSGRSLDADGGLLEIYADEDVVVAARVRMRGGKLGQGGEFFTDVLGDTTISGLVDLRGGDFGGGIFDVYSRQDLRLEADVYADSVAGLGYGGEIYALAGRDLAVEDSSGRYGPKLRANGHRSGVEGGDGGILQLDALRDLVIGPHAVLETEAARPIGQGASLACLAVRNLRVAGTLRVRNSTASRFGTPLDLLGLESAEVTGTAVLESFVEEPQASLLEVSSFGNVTFAGHASVGSTQGAGGGGASISARSAASVSGTLNSIGDSPGAIEVRACRASLEPGALLLNESVTGDNFVRAGESMQLLSGSLMTSLGGANHLLYRWSDTPPLLLGAVSPSAISEVDVSIALCCGNHVIDRGESCDDGNLSSGDGCGSDCTVE